MKMMTFEQFKHYCTSMIKEMTYHSETDVNIQFIDYEHFFNCYYVYKRYSMIYAGTLVCAAWTNYEIRLEEMQINNHLQLLNEGGILDAQESASCY